MTAHQLSYNVTLTEPATNESHAIQFFGHYTQQGGTPDHPTHQQIVLAMVNSTSATVQGSLNGYQVALPTLAQSMSHFVPQIVQMANGQLAAMGVAVADVSLTATVPPAALAPGAAAIAAAPDPLQSGLQNFTENVAAEAASSVPNRLNVNVGGYKVGLGADGVDGDGLVNQVMNKVKSNLIGYAIVAGVLFFVTFICCGGVAYKLLMG